MFIRKELKDLAKLQLKGNLGVLILGSFLCFAPLIVPMAYLYVANLLNPETLFMNNLVYYVLVFLSLFITAPLGLGVIMTGLDISKRLKANISDLFRGFHYYGKVVGQMLLIYLVYFLSFAITIGPIALSSYALSVMPEDIQLLGIILIVFAVLFALVAAFFLIPFYFSLLLATFVLADDPENVTIIGSLKKSIKILNHRKAEFFVLSLSFTLWILLSYMTCFILYFVWVLPYFYMTLINYYNKIKGDTIQVAAEELTEEKLEEKLEETLVENPEEIKL